MSADWEGTVHVRAEDDPVEMFWAFLDPYYDTIDYRRPPEEVLRQMAALPPGIAALSAANILFAEVQNGAFQQFFFNSTGVIAPEALAAHRDLGLHESAAIVEEAIGVLGPTYPRDLRMRRPLVEKIEEDDGKNSRLLELSGRYFDSLGPKHARFIEACNAYAERHGAR